MTTGRKRKIESRVERTCGFCGKKFKSIHRGAKFCSRSCSARSEVKRRQPKIGKPRSTGAIALIEALRARVEKQDCGALELAREEYLIELGRWQAIQAAIDVEPGFALSKSAALASANRQRAAKLLAEVTLATDPESDKPTTPLLVQFVDGCAPADRSAPGADAGGQVDPKAGAAAGRVR